MVWLASNGLGCLIYLYFTLRHTTELRIGYLMRQLIKLQTSFSGLFLIKNVSTWIRISTIMWLLPMDDSPVGRQFMFCHHQKYAICLVSGCSWEVTTLNATVDTQFINLKHPFKLFPECGGQWLTNTSCCILACSRSRVYHRFCPQQERSSNLGWDDEVRVARYLNNVTSLFQIYICRSLLEESNGYNMIKTLYW